MTTYHRTLLLIEVLGNEPFEGGLEDLERATSDGEFSGATLMVRTEQVSQEQMQQLLIMQGSSPEFLIPEDDVDRRIVPLLDQRSLSVNVTDEGIILDLIEGGEVVGTEAATFAEIADRLGNTEG